jgi:ParB/RepB/Spo0J family partition protein
MSSIVSIPIEEISHRADARQRDDEVLAGLEESIALIGLITPIRVRPIADGYEVVAGGHRLQACELLEHHEIACIVVEEDDLHAELAMIDENLFRAELGPGDRARQTARRKAIYLALHPKTAQHIAGAIASNVVQGNAMDNLSVASFASDTAKATAKDERTIRRDAERGEKIVDEAFHLIRGTKFDTGVFLDKLKKLPRDQQAGTVRQVLAKPAEPKQTNGEPTSQKVDLQGVPAPDSAGTYARFIELVDRLEALPVAAVIAGSGRQRSVLGQRASGLADRMSEIMEGLSR